MAGNRKGTSSSRRSSTKSQKKTKIGKDDEVEDLESQDSQESQDEENAITDEQTAKDKAKAMEVEDEGNVEDDVSVKRDSVVERRARRSSRRPSTKVKKGKEDEGKDTTDVDSQESQEETNKDGKVEIEEEDNVKDNTMAVDDGKVEDDGKTEVEVTTGHIEDGTGSENIQDGRPDVSKKLPQMEIEGNQSCADKDKLVSELDIKTNANALVGTQGEKEAEDQLKIKEDVMVEKNGTKELNCQDKTNMEVEDAQPRGGNKDIDANSKVDKNSEDEDSESDESSDDDDDNAENDENHGENEVEMKDDTTEQNLKTKNGNLLPHFWKLASLNENERSEAVVCLLKELQKTRNQDELNYTVQRLVKGLSSSRKAARQGFSTALTHVLSMFTEVTSDHVLDLMSKHLTIQGSFKGHEECDAYFGQVFGLLAIRRSRIGDANTDVDKVLMKILTENLLALMKKKSYLGEICGVSICDILKCIDFTAFSSIEPLLNSVLTIGWIKSSPEDLMIALIVQSKFKDNLSPKYFKKHWKRSLILHEVNFKRLSRVLMDTTNTAHPRVHVLWDIVLDYLFSLDHENNDTFDKFWQTVVLDGLMHSTHERKFLVMNIVLKIVSRLPFNKIGIVFGESIIRCMINSCQSKMNYLYSCVRNMLTKLPEKLSENENENVISSIIKCLVGRNGHVAFDSITKTDTVEKLTSMLPHGLPAYFEWLRNVFAAGTTSLDDNTIETPEKDAKECRAWVADQLIILLRTCKSQSEESLLADITYFLFFHSHFVCLKQNPKELVLHKLPSCAVTDATHQLYRLRFNTALTELTNIFHTKHQGENKSPIGGIAQDGELYAWKILCFAKKLLEMPEYAQLVMVWTPEIYESWNNSMEKISTMLVDSEKTEGTVNSTGAQLLLIHTTLQLFLNREEAVDILKELEICFKKAKEKKKRKKTEPHWTEVLTEILLGFLVQSSHLMRQVVDLVYPTLVPHLTETALELLIKAIKPVQKSADDGMEFENVSDMEDENMEEDVSNENDEKDKDKEVVESEKGEDTEENEEESDSDDDSDESDEDFEVDEAFKAELKTALGDAAVSDEEDNDNDDSDSSDDQEDIDMDTCEPAMMKAMDKALADVFKSRKQKQMEKKNKKDRKLSILHFKLRVLDLIEIFIKRQPKDIKIFLLLEPLYEVINTSNLQSDQQPLFERSLGIVKNKLCNLHEYPSGNELDVEGVHTQIERLIELARTASSALMVEYISLGIIYLIRVLRGSPETKEPSPRRTRSKRAKKEIISDEIKSSHVGCLNEDRLIGCYRAALTEFMTKKSSHFQPVLFNKLMQRFPYLGWRLAVDLPQYINDGCNNFRKVKALEMLKLLFSNKGGEFEKCLHELHREITSNIIRAFQATKLEGYSLKARQFHLIVELSGIFIKEVVKYPEVCKEVDRDNMKASLREALDSPVVARSTSLQTYCKKVLSSFDGTPVQGKQRSKKKKKKVA